MYSYVVAHGATPENFIFSGMADGASNYNFNWNLIKIVALSLYGAIPDNITFSGLTPWAIPKLTLRFLYPFSGLAQWAITEISRSIYGATSLGLRYNCFKLCVIKFFLKINS